MQLTGELGGGGQQHGGQHQPAFEALLSNAIDDDVQQEGREYQTHHERDRVGGGDDWIGDDGKEEIFTQSAGEEQQKEQGDKRPGDPKGTALAEPGAPHHYPSRVLEREEDDVM